MPVIGFVVLVFVIWLFSCLTVLNEYERGVIFRLGKLLPAPKGPFWAVLRTYGPGKSIENHTWKLPPVKRVK